MRHKKILKNNNNNNNNNDDDGNGGGGADLFTLKSVPLQNLFIPEVPNFNDIFNPLPEEYNLQQWLNLQQPEVDDLLQQRLNNLRGIPNPNSPARREEVHFFCK